MKVETALHKPATGHSSLEDRLRTSTVTESKSCDNADVERVPNEGDNDDNDGPSKERGSNLDDEEMLSLGMHEAFLVKKLGRPLSQGLKDTQMYKDYVREFKQTQAEREETVKDIEAVKVREEIRKERMGNNSMKEMEGRPVVRLGEERRKEEEEVIADARLWSKKEISELREDFHGLIMEVRGKIKELQELWKQEQSLQRSPALNTWRSTRVGFAHRRTECLNCRGSHRTDLCHSMLDMPLEKRVEILTNEFACF